MKAEDYNKFTDGLEKKVKSDVKFWFMVISILFSLLILFMGYVGYFTHKSYEASQTIIVTAHKVEELTQKFNAHEHEQKLHEREYITTDKYCLSTSLLFLNIKQIKAMLSHDTQKAEFFQDQIDELEAKKIYLDINQVTRGIKISK